jgi:hypothetical protein
MDIQLVCLGRTCNQVVRGCITELEEDVSITLLLIIRRRTSLLIIIIYTNI